MVLRAGYFFGVRTHSFLKQNKLCYIEQSITITVRFYFICSHWDCNKFRKDIERIVFVWMDSKLSTVDTMRQTLGNKIQKDLFSLKQKFYVTNLGPRFILIEFLLEKECLMKCTLYLIHSNQYKNIKKW